MVKKTHVKAKEEFSNAIRKVAPKSFVSSNQRPKYRPGHQKNVKATPKQNPITKAKTSKMNNKKPVVKDKKTRGGTNNQLIRKTITAARRPIKKYKLPDIVDYRPASQRQGNLKRMQQQHLTLYRAADGVYNSYWVGKLLRMFIREGNISTAEKHVYSALRLLHIETKKPGNQILYEIIELVKPSFGIRNRRVSRRKIKLQPYFMRPEKQYALAIKWIKKEVDFYWKEEPIFYDRILAILEDRSQRVRRFMLDRRANLIQQAVDNKHLVRFTWRRR